MFTPRMFAKSVRLRKVIKADDFVTQKWSIYAQKLTAVKPPSTSNSQEGFRLDFQEENKQSLFIMGLLCFAGGKEGFVEGRQELRLVTWVMARVLEVTPDLRRRR